MKTGGNPYSGILALIQSQAGKASTPGWGLGVVVSTSPLKIAFRGIALERAQVIKPHGTALVANQQLAVFPNNDFSKFLVLPVEGA